MRIRGTALVFRERKVLLVRDRGKQKFSLPGGQKSFNESSLAAAVRELYEELGMSAKKAERLFKCDYRGGYSYHKVSLIETNDQPYLRDKELVEFIWWNQVSPIDCYEHVGKILAQYRD
ncbi:MAG: NUDIX domain-containing protein [Snowella sp.]|nr:NUDIX domain-containing protein [Snowella sp.]